MSTENNQYVVYPDKMRQVISVVVYAFFAFLEAYVLVSQTLKIYWDVLLVILMAFFIWQMVLSIRTLIRTAPLLVISDEGIRDYTSGVDFGLIPWSAIEKVETLPGSTSMQIGILISKHFKFNSNSKSVRTVAERNRQRTGFTLLIDGFSIGGRFKKTVSVLKEYGLKNKPSLIMKEYRDPFMNKVKKKK